MAFYDDLLNAPTIIGTALGGPVGGYLGYELNQNKQDQKAQEEARAYATPSGQQLNTDIGNAVVQGKAEGKARGNQLFGQESDLTPISQNILKERQDLAQGLNAQQLSAARQTARNQIQSDTQQQLSQLQGIQGRQGIKGGMAAAQQLGVLRSGADQQRQLERDLLTQNYAAQTQGLNNLASDVNARLYGIQASEAGASNEALAEQSLAKGLQIAALPNPTPTPGLLGGVTQQLSVICTELKRQGLLDEQTQRADCLYGLLTISNAHHVYVGYVVWAKYIAALMRKSKLFTKFVCVFAIPWANHMAFTLGYKEKDNLAGRIVHEIGYPICGIIGKIIKKLRGLYGLQA